MKGTSQFTGGQAVVEALLRHGISAGFGIPSIHNIALYDALRQAPKFRHWVVRHEQAAAFAADGFFRRGGRLAAVFASTGPGNLFTLVPLLESLQAGTPVLVTCKSPACANRWPRIACARWGGSARRPPPAGTSTTKTDARFPILR